MDKALRCNFEINSKSVSKKYRYIAVRALVPDIKETKKSPVVHSNETLKNKQTSNLENSGRQFFLQMRSQFIDA